MKIHTVKLIVAAVTALGITLGNVTSARAYQGVSVGVSIHATAEFEAPLAAHGTWVEVGTYGHCWRPAGIAVGWRPYCVGSWVWTDCGWYWETDEPWGWACYHYGSWVLDPVYGWVWVPGIEWAPAWVVWRSGGGYIGWAPCAPRGVFVAPGFFAFVEVGHFHERIRPSTVVVNNTVIINKTTQINEVKRETRVIAGREQRMVVNDGPGVAVVERATGRKITAAPVQEVASRAPAPESLKSGRRQDQPAHDTRPTPARDAGPDTAQPNRETQPKRDEPVMKPEQPTQPREGERPGKVTRPPRQDNPRDGDDRDSSRGRDGGRDGGQKEKGHGRGGGDGQDADHFPSK
jgi:hypothetical protein